MSNAHTTENLDDAPTITVMEECPLHGEQCNDRWFNCNLKHGAKIVAKYSCRCYDEDGDLIPYVTQKHIDRAWELHPGCRLVY